MKKKIGLLLSLFIPCLGMSVWAQKTSTPAKKSAPVKSVTAIVQPYKPLEKSLLWKISGKGLSKPSYVFGTMHAICTENYFFTPKMNQAYASCNQLVLEMNLADESLLTESRTIFMLPEGITLRDYFSDAASYETFAQQLIEKTGLDIEMFTTLKPMALLSAMSMKTLPCQQTTSYETKLVEAGRERKVKVTGLETLNMQMSLINELPREEQRMLLEETLKEIKANDGGEENQNQLLNLYTQQDIEGLSKMIDQEEVMKAHAPEFLFSRNHNWVNQLGDIMKKTPSFIAVGAAHLPGDDGLINLLRKKGYTVEAVK
ncbi:MAG: hypothetical protein RIQ62_1794 [Bacteroidota bacterium]